MSYTYKTTCPLDCWDACGLEVTVRGDEVVDIQGDKDHEITRGYLCSKGKKHLQRIYREDRLTKPLLNKDGDWEEISWDEAINLIVDKLHRALNRDSRSIMYYTDSGYGGVLGNIEKYFFELLGNLTVPEGSLCWSAGMEGQYFDFGTSLSHDYSDVLSSEVIFMWGRNSADTAIHQMNYIKRAQQMGTKVISIDPRKTRTALQADEHIAIKPGTDGALALAMAKYIIDQEMVDRQYLEKAVLGFNEFTERVSEYTPEWAAQETGISSENIRRLAEEYAGSHSAAILIGYGLQRYTNSANTVRAIDALAAITGNIGKAGGGVNYANKQAVQYIDQKVFEPPYRREHRTFPKAKLATFLLTEQNPHIDMMIFTMSNPFLQAPNTDQMYRAFESVDFKVTIDLFMTDTAKHSDLVLPCASFLEKEDIFLTSMGHNYMSYGPQIIDPVGETKSERDIFTLLAKHMGLEEFPDLVSSEWLKRAIDPLTKSKGITLEKLKEDSFRRVAGADFIPWCDGEFATPSGKYELKSTEAEKQGLTAVPTYTPPFQDQETDNEYPLYFLTPHHRDSIHSQHFLDKEGELGYLYINPETAALYQLEEYAHVMVNSAQSSLQAMTKFEESLRQDTVYMYEGMWIGKGGSVNSLITDKLSDAGLQAALYETKVNITKM